MNRFREMMKDSKFIRGSFFILFNAFLLYVFYFVIKNFTSVTQWFSQFVTTTLDVLSPLIIGLILAYLLNPLVTLIDSKGIGRLFPKTDDEIKAKWRTGTSRLLSIIVAILLVFAVIIALLYGLAVMVIGQVSFDSLSTMITDLASALMSYEEAFRHWIAKNVPEGVLSEKLTAFATWLIGWLGNNISASSIIGIFTGIGGGVVKFVIGLIIAIYLMKDRDLFLNLWQKAMKLTFPRRNESIGSTVSEINDVLSHFIRGALMDALIIAVLSSIGLSILGLEAAVFIGVFAGVCNIIPYFGPVMGMIPAFLMGFCTEGFWQGAIAVIILFVIQQIDSNFIYPKIVGSTTGLHPLAVLLSVSIFGSFWGIAGMLLAVPLAGIIKIFAVKIIERRKAYLDKKNLSEKG